jgi:hypothetical protein
MDTAEILRYHANKGTYCPDKLMTTAANELESLRAQLASAQAEKA